MPHHLLQFVVQEKGHHDLVSDESPVTKGVYGAAQRGKCDPPTTRPAMPARRTPKRQAGQETLRRFAVWVFVEALGKRVVSLQLPFPAWCLHYHTGPPAKRRSTHGKLSAPPPLSAHGRVRWPLRLNHPFWKAVMVKVPSERRASRASPHTSTSTPVVPSLSSKVKKLRGSRNATVRTPPI